MAKNKTGLADTSVVANRLSENKANGLDTISAGKQDKNVKTVAVNNGAGADKRKDLKANRKPNIFKRMGRTFKEMGSELKKINWLDAKQVFARLGVVLLVVLIFLVVITAFDYGCGKLLDLLILKKV